MLEHVQGIIRDSITVTTQLKWFRDPFLGLYPPVGNSLREHQMYAGYENVAIFNYTRNDEVWNLDTRISDHIAVKPTDIK